MLVIVGPQWLTPGVPGGEARLFEDDDYVRAEIEQAIAEGVTLIPVLVDGASMPSVDSLPASVQVFAYRQAVQVRSDPDFHTDMERLLGSPPFDLKIERSAPFRGPIRPKRAMLNGWRLAAAIGFLVVAGLFIAVVLTSSDPEAETSDTSGVSTTTPTADGPTTTPDGSGDALRPLEPSQVLLPSDSIRVETDSTLAAQGRFDYSAANLTDGDLETAWVEGVEGLGVGQRVVFRLSPAMPVERIEVWPGWQTSASCRFEKNARPTAVTAEAVSDAGARVSATSARVDALDPRSRLILDLPPAIYTDVTIVISEVAPGAQCDNGPFEDTAISEVRFFAPACVTGFTEVGGELVPSSTDLPLSC